MKDDNFAELMRRHDVILLATKMDDVMEDAEEAYGFLDMSNPFKEDAEGANYLKKFVDHLDRVCEVLHDGIVDLWAHKNIEDRDELMFLSQRAYPEIVRYFCGYKKMLEGVEKDHETRVNSR